MDVALVTCSTHPQLDEDDRPLLDALRMRGLAAEPVVWDDSNVDWHNVGVAVIRSTWDYHQRLDEFLIWTRVAAAACDLWNPAEVLRWNAHKKYLSELGARGAQVVPTEWLPANAKVDLATRL